LWSGRTPKVIRTATREDLDKALILIGTQPEVKAQEGWVSQMADMPDSTLVLVLEMTRANLASQLERGEALQSS
jgi:hypothetical protein